MDRKSFLKVAWLPGLLSLMVLSLLLSRNYHLDKLDSRITSDSVELDSKRALLASVGDLCEELAAIAKSMDRDRKQLFDLDKAESMVEMIGSMASYYGVKMADFKFQIPEYVEERLRVDRKAPYVIRFEGKFRGDYVALGRTIESLEKMIFVKEVSNIRLVVDKPSGNEVVANMEGEVRLVEESIRDVFDRGQSEKTD